MDKLNEEARELYDLALEDFKFVRKKTCVSETCTIYNMTSELQQRIDAEIKLIVDKLSISYDKSILICQNSKYPYILSALMTGPKCTPYDSACILFDIYLPVDYPNVPPKITCKIKSSFVNPNIMDDGEVKISFLEKKHDNNINKSEYWDPNTSTLYKTLQHIQDSMLVKNPYFNNKFTQNLQHENSIKNDSENYNKCIRLIMVAEGIYKLLVDTPDEFAEVIECHFYLKYNYISKLLRKLLEKEVITNTRKKYNNQTMTEIIRITGKELTKHYIANTNGNDDPDTVDSEASTCTYNSAFESDSDENSDYYGAVYNMAPNSTKVSLPTDTKFNRPNEKDYDSDHGTCTRYNDFGYDNTSYDNKYDADYDSDYGTCRNNRNNYKKDYANAYANLDSNPFNSLYDRTSLLHNEEDESYHDFYF